MIDGSQTCFVQQKIIKFLINSFYKKAERKMKVDLLRGALGCSTILCSTIQMDLVRRCFGLRSTNRT
jgi:hypothetical protein